MNFFSKILKLRKKYPKDISNENIKIFEDVKEYTMTGIHKVNALINATEYIINNNIRGSIVECGVWKGGSMMAVALTLKKIEVEKELYLYDTFEGMSKPTAVDISMHGKNATDLFKAKKINQSSSDWCYSNLEEVKRNIYTTNYNMEKIHFIKGKVEDTIPKNAPDKIALLRLDTDWYESTKHEMIHLFPLLQKNGILIIDDYGYWEGSKKAIDEYIKENNIQVLLNRIDKSARLCIKT